MIDKEMLDILACPQNRMRLRLADARLLANLNRAVAAGKIKNEAGRPVESAFQGGLVREDGAVFYPIVDDIPLLLPEEAIPLGQLDTTRNGKN